jgi:hypothetical protein
MKKYFTFLAFIIAMQFATRLSAQNLSDSLLFHYPLDGNAIDVSGNGFNGNTWYGTYTDDRFGNPAGALSFNGYSTCIDLPYSQRLKPQFPFSVSLWVYLYDSLSALQIFTNDLYDDTYTGCFISTSRDNRIMISYGDGGDLGPCCRRTKMGTTMLSYIQKWYHIVGVFRGPEDMDIYVNGANDGGTYEGDGDSIAYSSNPGSIGRKDCSVHYPESYFYGAMDDIAFWNRALTQTDVDNLYNYSSELPGAAGNITGPYTFCHGQTGVEYSVEPIPYATGYVWTIPSGTTIVSGANTHTITVDFSNTAVPGSFTVYGTNSLGNGTVSSPYDVTIDSCVMVSGTASYPNIDNTPLDDLTIKLKNTNKNVVGTTTTNTDGFYLFPKVPSGNYSLNVSTTKTWDGVTASDILLFHRYIVNTYNLSGIFLASGDIDLSNDLTASDVLLMKKRIAHVSNSFPSGDWLFNNQLLTVDNTNITHNFNGIVYGDANGSYIPTETDFDVRYQGNISIGSVNESIGELTLPVIVSNMPNLGSFQFTIQYDASKLQWLGVTDWYPGIDMAMVANPAPGLLTFVWAADANGINISQGALCNLRFNSKLAGSSAISFENNPTKKEFSDYEGNLFAPQYTDGNIGSATNITDPTSSEVAVYPNPSNGQFTLNLTAIQPGTFDISLYNSLGVMAYQKSVVGVNGKTRLNLNMTTLPDGVYSLRVQGRNINYISKIVINK